VRAVFEGEEKDEEMKEEEDVRSERRRELLPLSIHRKRKTTTEFWRDSCSCVFFVGLFRREILRIFSSFPAKRLNFFFPRRLYCCYTIYARKNLFLLCDDAFKEQQQRQHATTTKESTS
tara:strand:- start:137 stop:493 length:357 start_codon:yes stop_codon:yes gene_type:complete